MSLGRKPLRYCVSGLAGSLPSMRMLGGRKGNLRDRRGQGTTKRQSMAEAYGPVLGEHTVFFFAKSPEAPRTTITVLFLSSMALRTVSG